MCLDDVVKHISLQYAGGTDCALPFVYAMEKGLDIDSVEIYTDNESWAGPVHVHQALKQYRDKHNPNTRLIAVGMTATEYSVADPQDPLSMNVAGFDSSAPAIISDFVRG
jgi:60 kDa SS-A/Ro ribonucleoprotein